MLPQGPNPTGAGHPARIRVDTQGRCLGYFVAMRGVGEMHLLNLTVDPAARRRGVATAMLRALADDCRRECLSALLLEVRESNLAALGLYRRFGFAEVGRRRDYYPAAGGSREDAVVMSLDLTQGEGHALD